MILIGLNGSNVFIGIHTIEPIIIWLFIPPFFNELHFLPHKYYRMTLKLKASPMLHQILTGIVVRTDHTEHVQHSQAGAARQTCFSAPSELILQSWHSSSVPYSTMLSISQGITYLIPATAKLKIPLPIKGPW